MTNGPLLPPFDEENAPFWEAARRGELRLQRCSETGRLIFPPRQRSPWAPHTQPVWSALSGRGTIWSFVVVHPPLLPYYAERSPYNVILVALEEDVRVRLIGNLVASEAGDIGEVEPDGIEIGARVRVVFQPVGAEIRLPRWILA